jgi:adenine-specific DNA methylase
VQEIQEQLSTPESTAAVYQMVQALADAARPTDQEYDARQKVLADLTAYRDGTYSLFGEAKEPHTSHVDEMLRQAELAYALSQETGQNVFAFEEGRMEPVTPQEQPYSAEPVAVYPAEENDLPYDIVVEHLHVEPQEHTEPDISSHDTSDPLAEAMERISEYTAQEFGSEADFRNLHRIDLAYSTTADGVHEIQVSADLISYKVLYEVDNQIVSTVQYHDLTDMNGFLGNMSFSEMIDFAEMAYENERESPDAPTVPTIPAANFHITDNDLGCGSVRQKFLGNLTAIGLLKQLELDNRNATKEEQEVLSRYVGWGGMPQAFDPQNDAWSQEYNSLKELLDEQEYTAARDSVLNAHFTSPTVIKAIYAAVENLGFASGNILEPACGVGNFFGLLPESMQGSKLYGVELDSITGRIAKKLYPEADITVAGFETTDRRNFYDLAVGNVPFGNYRVDDKAYNKLGFNIHNYFFAKALDQVRPGGIVAFVTSRYTMDSKSEDARKYLAERAQLLGAIRLPSNAFQANAGTNVVSDILFLQKRERVIAVEEDWVHLGQTEDGITLNSYYVNHSQMILGELTTKSTQYGRDECTVRPIPGADLGQQLQEAVQYIHGQYLEAAIAVDDSIPADPNVKNFSFTLVDGQIYYRENSRMQAVSLSDGNVARVRGLIALRDCVRTLMAYETEDYPEADIQRQQEELNRLYDSFQTEYGRINSRPNRQAFADDDSYYLLCSLEVLDDEQHFQEKAAIFTKRTIRPKTVIKKADTAQEALVLCLNDRAAVDMPFMQEISGKSPEALEQELSGQIFRLPYTDKFVLAEEYLSGNVREKLREAQAAAQENPIYAVNAAALEQVQPKDLSAAEISVRLGSTWVPEADVRQFVLELLNPPWYLRGKIQVSYSPYTSAWQLDGKSVDKGIHALSTYGTQRKNAYEIIEDSLNLREVKVFDYVEADGKRKAVLNKKETAIAQGKQAEIKQAFQDWIWTDPERRERLTTLYNETFNNIRPREYDGSHLIFPGMNPEITLRPHQKNAIARALYGGNTLLAHCVGGGKSATRS